MHEKTADLCELHTDAGYGSEDNDLRQADLGIEAVQTAIRGRVAQAPMRIERDEAGLLHIRCAAGHLVQGRPTAKHHKAEFAAASCARRCAWRSTARTGAAPSTSPRPTC